MNWNTHGTRHRELLEERISRALIEMADTGWPGAAAAIAVDLDEGRCIVVPRFDPPTGDRVDPASLVYVVHVPLDGAWQPWLPVPYAELEIDDATALLELQATLATYEGGIPDDISELETP